MAEAALALAVAAVLLAVASAWYALRCRRAAREVARLRAERPRG